MALRIFGKTGGHSSISVNGRRYTVSGDEYSVTIPPADEVSLQEPVIVEIGGEFLFLARVLPDAEPPVDDGPPQAPIADAGPDRTAPAGETILLDGSGSTDPDGTLVSYVWTLAGGQVIGTGGSAFYTSETEGNEIVTLTVTDDDDLSDSDSFVLNTVLNSGPILGDVEVTERTHDTFTATLTLSEPLPAALEYRLQGTDDAWTRHPDVTTTYTDATHTRTVTGLVAETAYDVRFLDPEAGQYAFTANVVTRAVPATGETLSVRYDGVEFASVPGGALAYVSTALVNAEGAEIDCSAVVRWRLSGGSGFPYDHTASVYPTHRSRLPAKDQTSSNPPTTIGPLLSNGDVIEFEAELTALDGRSATLALTTETVTISAPTGGTTLAERYQPMPLGLTWNILRQTDQGESDGSHPRVTLNQVKDGMTCYRHSVAKNEVWEMTSDYGIPLEIDFSTIDKFMLRFHQWRDAHPQQPGKDIQLMGGRGFQGDMVRNSDGRFNPPISQSEAFGSTEFAMACSMHPKVGNGNGTRLFGTHAYKIPNYDQRPGADNSRFNGDYYGDNMGASGILPLNQWVTIDLIGDRNTGWSQYADGVLIGQSDEGGTKNRIFDDWDAQRCIWQWHRHMAGGNPPDLPAPQAFNEWFGNLVLAVY